MTTYYPAPSGTYTQIITTQNAFLARDTGTLVIGSGSAANGIVKMAVMGNVGINQPSPTVPVTQTNPVKLDINDAGGAAVGLISNEKIQTGDVGTGIGDVAHNRGAVYFNSVGVNSPQVGQYPNGNNPTIFGISNGGASSLYVSGTGNVGVDGLPLGGITLNINGGLSSRDTSCTAGPTTPGGPNFGNSLPYVATLTTVCPANTYATWASGIISNYQYDTSVTQMITGTMLCCPCPTGTCASIAASMP